MSKVYKQKEAIAQYREECDEKFLDTKKVYCCNCSFYSIFLNASGGYSWPLRRYALCKHTKKFKYTCFKKFAVYNLCEDINPDNDCPHYKRKWYKFWVK